MKRLLLLLLFPTLAVAQTVPNGGITQGQVWSVPQWVSAWQSKADTASPAFTGVPTLNGIALPSYPQTAAEVSASVTPTNYTYPSFNALRYGCDPTGAASSTTCFTNAGAVAASAGGATIIIPAGTYKASGVTFLSAVFLQGAGTNATTIQNTATNTPIFTWGNNTTQYYNGGIAGITFTGASGIVGVTGQTAFSFLKVGQFNIVDVFVSNLPSALYRGAYFQNSSQFHVERLRVQGCLLDGISFIGTTDEYVLSSRSDANGAAGWTFSNSQGGFFAEDTAYNNSGVGWSFNSTTPATAPNFNNKFTDIVGDTSGSYNIQINDCINCYFTNPWASTQQSTTVNTFASGIIIASQYSKGITITGGQAINNNAHGVSIFDSGGSPPTGITIDNFQFGATENGANGNGKAAGGGYGASINGAANKIRIMGGIFEGNTTGAYLNQSSQTDICIIGNPIGLANSGCTPTVINGANSATGTGLQVNGTFTGAGTTQLVAFGDPNNTNGLNILLTGNGATTPNKYIRVIGGQLQILNSAYSGNALTLTDAGLLSPAAGIQLPVTTVAALPACAAGNKGQLYAVSDATAPTYNAALTGGGAVSIPVYCNGSAWTAH